jgi:DNA repair protein RadA/Sms
MVLAVLEARCGLSFGACDVYLNVAGGLRVTEPAADLAVAAALISSLTGQPVPSHSVVFGEIGLSGEVRPVGQTESRLKEAAKLGFTRALVPARRRAGRTPEAAIATREIARLGDLVALFEAHAERPERRLRQPARTS